MLLYRIAQEHHIRDLSGIGARDYGGRWNHKGTPVIYTSESRALATLEYLVHADFTNLPKNLKIASIKVPKDASLLEISPTGLPEGWQEHPSPQVLADIGKNWAKSQDSLLLKVPSAIVPQEHNLIINSFHPGIGRVVIAKVEDFEFDPRFLT